MSKEIYQLRRLDTADAIPFDLLLLADETVAAIEKYIYNADIYIVEENDSEVPVAVAVLFANSHAEVEIKNIAVAESKQGYGIGSWLINELKKTVLPAGYQRIVVGTPDTASREIFFYEKNGFRKYAIKENFFLVNYTNPIIENGIALRNMQMLEVMLY